MESEYSIFVVDDAEAVRRMIESVFGKTYTVETFASGADCLERMREKLPGLFLLDVDMPEMDGYALCRRIKSLPACSNVPVIFISALDDLESRLAGYDAGGDEFIVKPYKLAELKKKVEVLRRIGQEKSALLDKLGESDMLTSKALSHLDEYAVLVKFLRSLNRCEKYPDVADAILSMLKSYRLDGALQLRLADYELTLNVAGENNPLATAIISHVRSLGTLAVFKNRAVFNFDRVSVLINNMPLAQADLCDRLRDYLEIAVESVDTRLLALQTRHQNSRTKGEVVALLHDVGAAIQGLSEKYVQARFQSSELTRVMLNELDAEFSSLGMRETQENSIKEIIESRTDRLLSTMDFSVETEKALNDIQARLARSVEATETPAD